MAGFSSFSIVGGDVFLYFVWKSFLMRSTIIMVACVVWYMALSAQGVFSNKTQTILEKVIQDYPNRFFDIKGELIAQNRQATQYRSTLLLPGATSAIITRYNNTSYSEDYSWSCAVMETGGFAKAQERFQKIYEQISNCIITTAGRSTFIVSGQYEEPVEGKDETHIIFSLLPSVAEGKKLKVELSMRKVGANDWKISLGVYDRDPNMEWQTAVTVN